MCFLTWRQRRQEDFFPKFIYYYASPEHVDRGRAFMKEKVGQALYAFKSSDSKLENFWTRKIFLMKFTEKNIKRFRQSAFSFLFSPISFA